MDSIDPAPETAQSPRLGHNEQLPIRDQQRVDWIRHARISITELHLMPCSRNPAPDPFDPLEMRFILVNPVVDRIVEKQASTLQLLSFELGRRRSEPATRKSPRRREFKRLQLTRFQIELGRISLTAWNDQMPALIVDQKVALRSQPSERSGIVGMDSVSVGRAVVPPDRLSRCRIHTENKSALQRPNASGEIDPFTV